MKFLVGCLMLTFVLAAPHRSAEACTGCRAPTLTSSARFVDTVFSGTIANIGGGGRGELTVTVDGVWKGTVGATVVVTIADRGCKFVAPIKPRTGRAFVFTARTAGGGGLAVDRCNSLWPATHKNRASLVRMFGAHRPPS